MVATCEQVWREISNYLENDLDPTLRTALEEHFDSCPRCASVLAGTRNVVQLYGDERMFQPPQGFSGRLRRRLSQQMPGKRGTIYGWLIAAAALALIAGGLARARPTSPSPTAKQSPLAKSSTSIPATLGVFVAGQSKIFHVAGCRYLRAKDGRVRSMTAEQAEQGGYVPCIHCLERYLRNAAAEFLKKHLQSSAAV